MVSTARRGLSSVCGGEGARCASGCSWGLFWEPAFLPPPFPDGSFGARWRRPRAASVHLGNLRPVWVTWRRPFPSPNPSRRGAPQRWVRWGSRGSPAEGPGLPGPGSTGVRRRGRRCRCGVEITPQGGAARAGKGAVAVSVGVGYTFPLFGFLSGCGKGQPEASFKGRKIKQLLCCPCKDDIEVLECLLSFGKLRL